MRAWYDILVMDFVGHEDRNGISQSDIALRRLIAQEITRGIPSSRIVLAGFSQGCAMALHTGLRLEEKLAGIIGLSGYLPLLHAITTERHAANAHTPIFLAHGLYDPIVPLARAQTSLLQLQALDYDVRWHTYPMPHSVCTEEVREIGAFLRAVLV
jgi:phospholipase/carboxylesterase